MLIRRLQSWFNVIQIANSCRCNRAYAKLVDALGGNEMSVARYYMKRGAYVAAVNRAQKIVSRYQNTRYVEEALAMMELAYKKLDKPQLAADTRRVLETNFPQSPFLQHEWRSDDMPWWRYWR